MTKNSKTFYLKIIIGKLDFLKEIVVIQWNKRKKDFLLLSTKLIEKIPQKSEKILDEKNANVIIWSHD